ncbi:MAG: DUF975 family protein [Clostridia bacterium]|nr:DUF975 family protein [Clostridia bacterium]
MIDRKEIKRKGREHLKKHYLLILIICAISVFLGTEFTRIVPSAQSLYDAVTGKVTVLNALGLSENDEAFTAKYLDDLIKDNISTDREEAAERIRQLQSSTDVNSVLGRRRGVLAAVMNSINSGQLYAIVGTALHSILHSASAAAVIMILLSALLFMAVWVFIRNMLQAIVRRVLMETRVYGEYPMNHIFHFRMVHRWIRAALTLLLRTVFSILWGLTVVGFFIKHYSYFMVPFIVAEDPDIRPREAIRLSRRMMDGHKWECFKLDLSFLGWRILGYFTFGAVDIFWSVPYMMTAYTEYYALLRSEAKEKGIEGADRLNDRYLFEKADEALLRSRYQDIIDREDLMYGEIIDLKPRQRFFARNFGIWTGSLIDKRVYTHQKGLRHQARISRHELNGRSYPDRLNPLWTRKNAALTGRVNYLTPCTFWSLVVVFFSFCFIGWIWEVSLHLITEGRFVNRGALHGPWLPIYGSGVAMISVLLYRFRSKPVLEAAAIVVLCGLVEYLSSFFMEMSTGMRWWDYTGYFLNLNGRICGEGLAVFALGGMAAVYLLVPAIDAMVTRMNARILIPICLVLLLIFSGDVVYSHYVPNTGEGITDYERVADVGNETPAAGTVEG